MNQVRVPPGGHRNRFVRLFRGRGPAIFVLAIALGVTGLAWIVSYSLVENAREERFEFRTREIEIAIRDRMTLYEQVLWGGVGLHIASDEVSRAEWKRYVDILDVDGHWPGIQGLGYAIPVEPGDKDDHIAQIRAEGFANYTISPEGERSEYSAIIHIEPFDVRNQRTLGFDMWSDDMRREAMARARDTGHASTSGVITLVQETDEDVQRGFLTYVPVYSGDSIPTTVEARRATLEGWVYAPFRMGDLMAGILGSAINDVTYEIFDGEVSAETLLYDSDQGFEGSTSGNSERTTRFDVHGRTWTIVFHAADSFGSTAESAQPTVVGIAGITIDLLLFYVITSLGFLTKRSDEMVEEKTAELRSAKQVLEARSALLERKTEQLQRSNDELGQFASVASHDLREPLRTLRSYSMLLAERFDGELGDEGNRWLRYIAAASEHMSDLIRELLDYSQLDNQPPELHPVSLKSVAERAIENLQSEVGAAGASIEVEDLAVVDGDEFQLERLFQNLIANAVKYRSERTPHVEIFGFDEGDACRVCVKDNGIGIKREYHERIFEIFRRVDSRSKHPGTGIGLAVCHKVVAAHGGSIGVESVPGHGSTFWFTIPYKSRNMGVTRAGSARPAVAELSNDQEMARDRGQLQR